MDKIISEIDMTISIGKQMRKFPGGYGDGQSVEVVAEFNNRYSHIVVDDHCYLVLNGGKPASWLTHEAMVALQELPPNPDHHDRIGRWEK